MKAYWQERRVMHRIFRLTGLFVVAWMMVSAAIAPATDWQIEIVDRTGAGKYSSMKVDKEGNLHVAYVVDDGAKNPVKYGFWDHKTKRWFVMTIAQGGSFCSLTLDSQQRPHIAYVDAGTMPGSKLNYARWDGATWKIQAVPLNAEIIAYDSSIALDAHDRPSISFYEYTGPRGSNFRVRQRVVRFNGEYWAVETVDGDNQSGKFNSMAIDAQGHVHLAYANVNGMTAGTRYASWDGASWKLQVLEGLPANQAYVGYSMCLALDREGNPHISYSQYSPPYAIKYAVRKLGQWQIDVVDQVAGVGYPDRNSIFVTEAGQPYVSYFDGGRGSLKLAHREGQKWITETVEGNGAGFTSSLQIDRGVVWISYADEAAASFKIAHRPLSGIDSGAAAATAPGKK